MTQEELLHVAASKALALTEFCKSNGLHIAMVITDTESVFTSFHGTTNVIATALVSQGDDFAIRESLELASDIIQKEKAEKN